MNFTLNDLEIELDVHNIQTYDKYRIMEICSYLILENNRSQALEFLEKFEDYLSVEE